MRMYMHVYDSLANLIPPWEAVPPIWELRVGE